MKNLWIILAINIYILSINYNGYAETFQGVIYTVIEKSKVANIKCSMDIRLNEKVSEDFLQKLAIKLRKSESIEYDNFFISYYLNGMQLESGAWATSHFTPNLKIKILGTTNEDEKAFQKSSKNSSIEIIGEWIDDSILAAKITLLKRKGKILMLINFKDGSSSETEMIQKIHSGNRRFEEKGGNKFGEYFLILKNGNMCLCDVNGPVNNMPPAK